MLFASQGYWSDNVRCFDVNSLYLNSCIYNNNIDIHQVKYLKAGIKGKGQNWIESFLRNRRQWVIFKKWELKVG